MFSAIAGDNDIVIDFMLTCPLSLAKNEPVRGVLLGEGERL